MDPERLPPDHPARSREPSAAANRLHEADSVRLNVRLTPQDLEDDGGNCDVRDAEVPKGRANQPGALIPVTDDSSVLHVDPGGEAIGLAKAIRGAQALQVAFLEVLGRRLVVARDAELEGKLWHPLDRIRRNPGNRRD